MSKRPRRALTGADMIDDMAGADGDDDDDDDESGDDDGFARTAAGSGRFA